jgi:hypothetical protein
MLEHLLPVTDQVFGVNDRMFDTVLPEEIGQHLFPFDLREFSDITIAPKKVEGVEDQTVLTARSKFGL